MPNKIMYEIWGKYSPNRDYRTTKGWELLDEFDDANVASDALNDYRDAYGGQWEIEIRKNLDPAAYAEGRGMTYAVDDIPPNAGSAS